MIKMCVCYTCRADGFLHHFGVCLSTVCKRILIGVQKLNQECPKHMMVCMNMCSSTIQFAFSVSTNRLTLQVYVSYCCSEVCISVIYIIYMYYKDLQIREPLRVNVCSVLTLSICRFGSTCDCTEIRSGEPP